MRFFLFFSLFLGLFLCPRTNSWSGVANAQTYKPIYTPVYTPAFKVGAVLPLSGDSAGVGRAAAAALEASAQALRSRGLELELTVRDSQGDPAEADVQTTTLIAAGVHALVCFDANLLPGPEATALPLLSLAPIKAAQTEYTFSLAADDAQVLMRLALGPPQTPLALLAPADALGEEASRALRDISLGVVRYPAGRTPLTPEALLAATLEPQSIVIWDSAAGTVRAAEALTARGYTGVRVVRAEVWGELDALDRAELTGAVSALSPAVLGYRLSDTHPSKAQVSSFRRALSGSLSGSDAEQVTAAAAAWDAAQLVGAAAEQVLTYTEVRADSSTAAVREALLGALSGLGPTVGAGGSYDFSGDFTGERSAVLPESLVLGAWRGGRFLPYP